MRPNSRPFWFWAIPVNIVVIALIAIFILVIDEADEPTPVAEPSQPAGQGEAGGPGGDASGAGGEDGAGEGEQLAQPGEATREAEDPFALGYPEAPVAMVVFTDFQCPFCARHSAETESQLIDEYVNSSQLRIEWRDVDFFGDDSNLAARGAWAAGQQHRYIEFHQTLFGDGEALDPEDLTLEKLTEVAQSLNMDIAQFERDIEADEAYQHVRDNVDEAAAVGAFNTPAFLINGEPLSGAQPLEEFEKVIKAAAEDNPYEGGSGQGGSGEGGGGAGS